MQDIIFWVTLTFLAVFMMLGILRFDWINPKKEQKKAEAKLKKNIFGIAPTKTVTMNKAIWTILCIAGLVFATVFGRTELYPPMLIVLLITIVSWIRMVSWSCIIVDNRIGYRVLLRRERVFIFQEIRRVEPFYITGYRAKADRLGGIVVYGEKKKKLFSVPNTMVGYSLLVEHLSELNLEGFDDVKW